MPDNPHFLSANGWREAGALVNFEPVVPRWSDGQAAKSWSVHVMDHKQRQLDSDERTLEVYFGSFSMSQALKLGGEARRWALQMNYGPDPRETEIGGHPARVYELGPVPKAGDVDPRPPAVVTWFDGDLFYLVASDQLEAATLERIAESCYTA